MDDVSFDIINAKGDHIMVALSYYDAETISVFTSNPLALTLIFYDVTLVRKSGEGYVGYKMLATISDILAKFMIENNDAVLCFYCDPDTNVLRHHNDLLPQEYRSMLFSRMFDIYVQRHNLSGFINHRVEIVDENNPRKRQFAHFICKKEHTNAVICLGKLLMEK